MFNGHGFCVKHSSSFRSRHGPDRRNWILQFKIQEEAALETHAGCVFPTRLWSSIWGFVGRLDQANFFIGVDSRVLQRPCAWGDWRSCSQGFASRRWCILYCCRMRKNSRRGNLHFSAANHVKRSSQGPLQRRVTVTAEVVFAPSEASIQDTVVSWRDIFHGQMHRWESPASVFLRNVAQLIIFSFRPDKPVFFTWVESPCSQPERAWIQFAPCTYTYIVAGRLCEVTTSCRMFFQAFNFNVLPLGIANQKIHQPSPISHHCWWRLPLYLPPSPLMRCQDIKLEIVCCMVVSIPRPWSGGPHSDTAALPSPTCYKPGGSDKWPRISHTAVWAWAGCKQAAQSVAKLFNCRCGWMWCSICNRPELNLSFLVILT